MASRPELVQLRSANKGIVTLVHRDLARFWGTLDLAKPQAARDALLAFIPPLVTQYGDVAATVSADFYDSLRLSDGVRGKFSAVMADGPSDDRVTQTVRYGAGHLFTDTPDKTTAFLEGALSRLVLESGWDTIVESTRRDPQSSGWYRISGGGCSFCDGLAARGAVYSESSVDFAAHNACQCGCMPSWDPSRPEADVQQYEASRRVSSMTDEEHADHNTAIRDWLSSGA